MSPRESAKNERSGAQGINCKIFVNSELIFEIYDENYHMKKINLLKNIKIFWENLRNLFRAPKCSVILLLFYSTNIRAGPGQKITGLSRSVPCPSLVGGLKFSMAQKKLQKVPVWGRASWGKVPVRGSASWGTSAS